MSLITAILANGWIKTLINMDARLRNRYNYHFTGSFEKTKADLEAMLHNKWNDLSKKFWGVMQEDGSFSFKTKFSLIGWVRVIYFKGEIIKAGDGSDVRIILSPNVFLLIAIYLLPLISLNILFGDNSLMGESNERWDNLISLLIAEIILVGAILLSSFFIRRNFEKALRAIA